jgi:UDP-N-acetylmuramoyl-L-alanyl-D-glutamate--2,6-diaminopimelate ligase
LELSLSITAKIILINELSSESKKVYSVGMSPFDDVYVTNVNLERNSFRIKEREISIEMMNPVIPGIHNVWNASLAYTTARRLGVDANQIREALLDFPGVPGRFEKNEHPAGATFIVDFAHTPDTIELCLHTMKELGAKRIFHIYGFRGNGDHSKRPKMIEVSSGLAGRIVFTLDDLNGVHKTEIVAELQQLMNAMRMAEEKS